MKIWFHIHYLSGYFSGRLLKLDRSEKIVLILAAILPDFDSIVYFIFSGFQNPTPFHGGLTHTLLVGVILGIILAVVSFFLLKWKNPNTDYNKLFKFIILGIFGIMLHLFIDIFTIANEYGIFHHLYFWPASDFSYHFDILFADIFPRYPYFDIDKFMFLQYSPVSFRIVSFISLIVNLIFFSIVLIEFLPPKRLFPWDVFMYSDERKREPWINDNLELILNILLSALFFGAFLIRIDSLIRGILASL
ncbi:MAG: metal-dependent hydrolase [Candidatus Helarchaeota archaeon]